MSHAFANDAVENSHETSVSWRTVRRRVYSELLPYDTVSSRRVMSLLAAYGLELIVAVTPDVVHQVRHVMKSAERHGVRVSVWPMLSREEGRWLNVTTATSFVALVNQIYELSKRESWTLVEVLFDLEPTFAEMLTAIDRPTSLRHFVKLVDENSARLVQVETEFVALCDMLRAQGVALATAVVPMVATSHDPATWRALLGIPREPVDGTHGAMLYTSLLEGWSRGFVSRGDALGLLRCGADAARARWGTAAEVAVGLIGPGVFGDEPSYRGPHELAADVAVVGASGITSIALFDLGGVLSRPPAEAWLEALFVAPDTQFRPTLRARGIWAAIDQLPRAATFFQAQRRGRSQR